MIQKYVISIIVSLILKAIEGAAGKIDWSVIQAQLDSAIAAHLPSWLQGEAEMLANEILSECEKILESGDAMKQIMVLVAEKQYAAAASALKDLLLASWGGSLEAKEAILKVV